MNTQEVANQLVSLCREGKNMEAVQSLYSDKIVSVEPAGAPVEITEGKEAVIAKTQNFYSMVEEMHGGTVSDPVVVGNHFTVSMGMDITMKGVGRTEMNEICVYEVQDGKIVREQFFFTPNQG
ncbi:MAG: nuclear transport factor 2 family protein [Bacteroidota bacterium]